MYICTCICTHCESRSTQSLLQGCCCGRGLPCCSAGTLVSGHGRRPPPERVWSPPPAAHSELMGGGEETNSLHAVPLPTQRLSVCLSACAAPVCLSVCLHSACLSVCLPTQRLSVCLSACTRLTCQDQRPLCIVSHASTLEGAAVGAEVSGSHVVEDQLVEAVQITPLHNANAVTGVDGMDAIVEPAHILRRDTHTAQDMVRLREKYSLSLCQRDRERGRGGGGGGEERLGPWLASFLSGPLTLMFTSGQILHTISVLSPRLTGRDWELFMIDTDLTSGWTELRTIGGGGGWGWEEGEEGMGGGGGGGRRGWKGLYSV